MYEGDWINDQYEGNGKYIYENNIKIVQEMEKEQCIIQMEKLSMKVIGLMMNLLIIKINIKIY